MPTKSIYLDENTAKLAEDLASNQGIGLSELLREVLTLMSHAPGPIGQLAIVQDCSTIASGLEEDPYRFDTWLDVKNTRKLLLMGTTMYRVLSRYEQVWRTLLSSGAHVQVLLQGGIERMAKERPDSLTASIILGKNAEDTVKRKNDATNFLRNLYNTIEAEARDRLEARRTQEFVITHSAVLVWDKNPQSKVAVQIHPYTPVNQNRHDKDIRFSFVTSEKSRIYSAIIRPIAEVWSSATSIF